MVRGEANSPVLDLRIISLFHGPLVSAMDVDHCATLLLPLLFE